MKIAASALQMDAQHARAPQRKRLPAPPYRPLDTHPASMTVL